MRGRVIFAFTAELHRLDRTATAADPGFDPDFKEPALKPRPGTNTGESPRREHPPVRVPCQVDTKVFDELRMHASGDSPRSRIDLVFHFKDLERLGLVDADTGDALIQPGDRLAGIYDKAGRIVQAVQTPPGLYVTEARPSGFGLSMARPRRNLLIVTFEDRRQAAGRGA